MASIPAHLPSGQNVQSLNQKAVDSHRSLYDKTQTFLKLAAASFSSLSDLNEVGIFHIVDSKYGRPVLENFQATGKVPMEWISQGYFPGIWCALFNPRNTLSIPNGLPYILRLTFKAEYKIFDSKNPEHMKLWVLWRENQGRPNPWASEKNSWGQTMEDRMSLGLSFMNTPFSNQMPGHRGFYEDHSFGAAVGYSDYMGLVVLLPESIESLSLAKID